ncbi:hypothetical protein ACIQZG_22460 [Lysinibacillus sp. NPDC096418]|uniref:hypothetical protein n=1 Tax=Lysinibacillus sp. NPDC096418 TaxID=3364138 RepID=UPI0038016BB4
MKKYLGLVSVIILIITLFFLPNDWKIETLGILLGLFLAIKAPKGIWKFVAYVIFIICILLLLYLVIMGILMAGLIEIG